MKGSPRCPCIAATSTGAPALTAAWPAIPTAPGTATPAPGSTPQGRGEQCSAAKSARKGAFVLLCSLGCCKVMEKWDVIPYRSMYRQ